MTEQQDEAVGFLSYSHLDDDADEGRIRRLASKIQAEYRVLTGTPLEIFVDRKDLRWGQEWKERIDGALQTTTFFIPVLSPSFFASEECRREFFEFYNTARSLGVQQYLLAIRYAPVEDLNAESSDAAKAIAARTQYKDWSELRLVDEGSTAHRTAINDLARELRDLMVEVQAKPAIHVPLLVERNDADIAPKLANEVDPDDPYGDDISPIELLAEFPDRVGAWTAALTSVREHTEQFSSTMGGGSERLRALPGDKSFAARVLILRDVASELDSPASKIEEAGEEYMSKLLDLDPAVRAVGDIARAQTNVTQNDIDSLRSAREAIGSMVAAGQSMQEKVEHAIAAGRGLARMSRDLRPPLKRYEAGARNLIDGQAVIEGWLEMLIEVEAGLVRRLNATEG